MYLYDVIDDFYGVSAQQFVKDLMAIKSKVINLRVNSPGGDVFAGRAMATAIAEHPSRIVAHVDGLAASAASYVALAADEVVIAPGAFVMIHRAWGFTIGNAEDHLEQAALLEKIDDELVADYVRNTGNTPEAIKVWMDQETWFTAEEAVRYGFADKVAEAPEKSEAARWNLAAFDRAPRELIDQSEPSISDESDEAHERHQRACRDFALIAGQNRDTLSA